MPMTEKSLLRFQLFGMLSLVLLLTLALGGYFTLQQARTLHQETRELEVSEYRELQQVLLRTRNSMHSQLQHLIDDQHQRLEADLRQQVDQAIRMAYSLQAHEGTQHTREQVQQQIIETLRGLRFFEGRGYFFILDRQGNCLLNAADPELERRNLLELHDSHGKPVVKDLLQAMEHQDSNFISYYWPQPSSQEPSSKLVFARRFAPYDWIIATGEYEQYTRQRLQEQTIDQLHDHYASGDGYLTIIDGQQQLLTSGNPQLTSEQQTAALQSIEQLQQRGGGFQPGGWPLLGDSQRPQQLSLVSYLADWDWTLVNTLYLDSREATRLRRQQLLEQQWREGLQATVAAMLLASLLALVLVLIYNRGLARRFTLYRSDLESSQARLRQYAETDPLTGLPNRQRLRDRLEHAILQAEDSGNGLALLCIDLDHFKNINDSLGHTVGDALLMVIAQRLASVLSPLDTLCRPGGDEFIVLLENASDADHAASMAERLLESCGGVHDIEGHELSITLSIGIALYPDDGRSLHTLLQNADAAMYHAKDCGRNNFQFFTESLNQRVRTHLELENRLRQALARNELRLVYQPKYDLASGQLTGCEALLRWHCEQLGDVSPVHFIPVAEECGLIGPIGEWALREACRQSMRWQAAGLPPIRIAVNVSAHQFSQGDLAELVGEILQESGLPGELLELELTESVLAEDYQQLQDTLQNLKALGIHLTMDDFGTGFSSLSYLNHFKLDTLKIDRAFVRDLPDSGDHSALTEAIIAMARALGMHCVAEGIESPEQLEFLRSHGCESGQGYLMSRPLSPEQLAELLSRPTRPLPRCKATHHAELDVLKL